MSPLGYQKMSATPCNQNAEESFPVLSLKSREQEPPNPLLIRDKAFYRLGAHLWSPQHHTLADPPRPAWQHSLERSGARAGVAPGGRDAKRLGGTSDLWGDRWKPTARPAFSLSGTRTKRSPTLGTTASPLMRP